MSVNRKLRPTGTKSQCPLVSGHQTGKLCCFPTAHATAVQLLHLSRHQSDGKPYGCDRQATNNRD